MRLYNRMETDLPIVCAFDGRSEPVQLYNLSSGGCMVEAAPDGLAVGMNTKVVLDNTIELSGRVAWHIGRNVGIQFDVPLHAAVINKFGYAASGEGFDATECLDRFGLPLDAARHASAGHRENVAD